MTPRLFPIGPGIVFGLAIVSGAWFLREGVLEGQDMVAESTLFDEVMEHITERFVDPVDRDGLYDDAIEGVLDGLGDPNTVLLSRDAYENATFTRRNSPQTSWETSYAPAARAGGDA